MTFLKELYYGNISPHEHVPGRNPSFCRKADELEEKLRKRLSKEDEALFIQYSDQEVSVYSDAIKENFLFGFRFGMILMMEVFKESPERIRSI